MPSGPFSESFHAYHQAGWSPLPLPAGKKTPPPSGYTGEVGAWPSYADLMAWAEGPEGIGNIGIRLPHHVIGLDVDHYGGKAGAATLGDAVRRWGPLPSTWMSTSRTDGVSGIRMYAAPEGLAWPGELGAGVEIIQQRHRYAVVAPSIHPNGGKYQWVSPDGVIQDAPPAVDALGSLPEAWVDGITGGKAAISQARGTRNLTAAMEWLDELDESPPCERTAAAKRAALADVAAAKGSMHEVARNHVLRLVRLGEQMHPGVPAALDDLRDAFTASVTDKGRGGDARSAVQATNEWDRMVVAAVNLVTANPSAAQCDCGRAPLVEFMPEVTLPKIPEPRKAPKKRTMTLTRASSIKVRPVKWLWENRLPLGSLSLLGGREQIGKSTVAYTLAADITRGRLPGVYEGQPRAVIVAGTEDSWEHTIVPRLMGAGADLDLVCRVDVTSVDGGVGPPELPVDLADLEDAITNEGAALVLLDPLLSRLGGNLDSHKDADVRRALEPLVAVADRTRSSVLGLIHVNKGGSTDALTALMGSRAFSAVARSVLFAMADPDNDSVRVLGQPKSNLGPEQPVLAFRIVAAHVTDTAEGAVTTGKVEWLGEQAGTISDRMETAGQSTEHRTLTEDAIEWLDYYLTSKGGEDDCASVKKAAMANGHGESTLVRARKKLGVHSINRNTIPRTTCWALPAARPDGLTSPVVSPVESSPCDDMTDTTDMTGGRRIVNTTTTTSPTSHDSHVGRGHVDTTVEDWLTPLRPGGYL
jgi:hypothetical protein